MGEMFGIALFAVAVRFGFWLFGIDPNGLAKAIEKKDWLNWWTVWPLAAIIIMALPALAIFLNNIGATRP